MQHQLPLYSCDTNAINAYTACLRSQNYRKYTCMHGIMLHTDVYNANILLSDLKIRQILQLRQKPMTNELQTLEENIQNLPLHVTAR